jgi:predicted nucleic acid-binding Zn finger protein
MPVFWNHSPSVCTIFICLSTKNSDYMLGEGFCGGDFCGKI